MKKTAHDLALFAFTLGLVILVASAILSFVIFIVLLFREGGPVVAGMFGAALMLIGRGVATAIEEWAK